jgi:hypothetical protein
MTEGVVFFRSKKLREERGEKIKELNLGNRKGN